MSPLSRQRLRRRSVSTSEAEVEALAAAVDAADQLVPGAVVLPADRTFGPMGFPVVSIDLTAADNRLTAGLRPMIRTTDVAQRLARAEPFPVQPVTLLAFISAGPSDRAVRDLALVRPYCRTVLMVDSDELGEPQLSEFDYWGITVVSTRPVQVLVGGDAGPAPGSDLAAPWALWRSEQLYASALNAGIC